MPGGSISAKTLSKVTVEVLALEASVDVTYLYDTSP